jgi:hypothetical protein
MARKGSGVSLLFEALGMTLVMHLPGAAVARILDEHATKLCRVVQHDVEAAVDEMDLSAMRRVCIDETAARRGQNDIMLFVDIARARSATSLRDVAPRPSSSLRIMSTRTTPMPAASRRSASCWRRVTDMR